MYYIYRFHVHAFSKIRSATFIHIANAQAQNEAEPGQLYVVLDLGIPV